MKLKPQNTYKHLVKFTANLESRPILSGIHVTNEGHIEATDSHILLKLLNRVPAGKEMVLNPKELVSVEGSYPDTTRLFPSTSKVSCYLDRDTARNISKFLKQFNELEIVRLVARSGELAIKGFLKEDFERHGIEESFLMDSHHGDEIELYFTAIKLKTMLDFIADCATAPVEIRISSNLRPVVFEVLGDFMGIVAPVRVPKPWSKK